MRMKVSKAIRELGQALIALSYMDRSDEVDLTDDVWFGKTEPKSVYQAETFQPTKDSLKIGDIARFDYTTHDGDHRLRVGKVASLASFDGNSILIFDYCKNEYRRSHTWGIENIEVLKPIDP